MRQQHRIVIEGIDGAGKTTLITDLAHDFPFLQIVHRPVGVPFDTWWPEELDRTNIAQIPIYDRFFYSELVYGPIIRGKINADMTLVNNVAWFLRSLALLVYVRPHSERIQQGIRIAHQMDGVIENFRPLLETYDHIMEVERQWYGERFQHYDWATPGSYTRLAQVVEAYLG